MTTAPPTDSLPDRVRRLLAGVPVDLLGATVAAGGAFALLDGTGYSWLRAVVGLGFVLVLPGYALVSAAFPGRPRGTLTGTETATAYSPGTAERLALSFVFSLALLPVLTVGHGLLGVPFETRTVVGSVTLVVVVFSAVGALRRLARSPDQRYRPPAPADAVAAFRRWVFAGGTVDTALSLALAVAVVAAFGTFAVAVTDPTGGDEYTSVSLLAADGGDDLVASNYPTNFTAGEARNLTLRVENNYDAAGNYTAVAELQRVDGSGPPADVVDSERIGTLSARVPANDSWRETHAVEPTMTGENLRLVYEVYRGDPETAEEPEETVHLWVTVRADGPLG